MGANKVHPARGMRDFGAADKARRSRAISTIRSTFRAHGFDEIETPAVENLERLTSGEGGDNEKMLFRILRRGLDEKTAQGLPLDEWCDLGLRYDLTVPLARFYATHQAELPRVFRCIQIGPVWRAERPQKGRFRQFTQCDIDILGEAGRVAEVELIAATLDALETLGVEGLTLRINDRRLLALLLEATGVAPELRGAALIAIDKLDKIGLEGVGEELDRALSPGSARALLYVLEASCSGEGIDAVLRAADSDEARARIDELRNVVEAVSAGGSKANTKLDPTLVRGMGYYTGPIFEVEHDASRGSIAGGGRYDEMIGRFLGRAVPACGFSIGFERLIDLATLASGGERRRAALVYPAKVDWAALLRAKRELIERGYDARPLARSKRLGKELAELEAEGELEVFKLADDGSLES